jgi:hypothetical protein
MSPYSTMNNYNAYGCSHIIFISENYIALVGPPVSSTNKTERHDITEILLKVALNTIKPINRNPGPRMYLIRPWIRPFIQSTSKTFGDKIK